jgi:hypothetical protein
VVKTILFLLVVAGVAGWFAVRSDLESRREDIKEAQVLINNAKANVANKEAQVRPRREEILDIKAKIGKFTGLEETKAALAKEVPALEQARTDVISEFKEAVEKVRLSSAGLAWPDLTLPNGQVLKSVTIQKVTDSDVAFAHSGGVTRVHVSDLPPDLLDRFRHGRPPMVIGETPAAPSSSPAPNQSTAPPASTPAPRPSAAVSPKVLEMQATVRELEKRMAEYNRTAGLYQNQVQAYRQKDNELKQSGKAPVHTRVIPRLDDALRDLNVKMGELNARIGNLKIEIENATATASQS